jgi:ketosteroid isomerase-like protein
MGVVERLRDAINGHDLDALVDCFGAGYLSEQPAHPDRNFRGTAQVRANWETVLSGVPDIHAEVLRSADGGDTAWAEWSWTGSHADGAPFEMVGVTVLGVSGGQVAWARFYMEHVERSRVDVAEPPDCR